MVRKMVRKKLKEGDVWYLGSGLHLVTFLILKLERKVGTVTDLIEISTISWIDDRVSTYYISEDHLKNARKETDPKKIERITTRIKELMMVNDL